MLCTQKNEATRAPFVTGATRCRLVAGYSTICPAGSFTECTPYVSSTLSSPPSYSSGADKNNVAETSVLILCPVVAFDRIAVSTCVPKCPPPAAPDTQPSPCRPPTRQRRVPPLPAPPHPPSTHPES